MMCKISKYVSENKTYMLILSCSIENSRDLLRIVIEFYKKYSPLSRCVSYMIISITPKFKTFRNNERKNEVVYIEQKQKKL